MKKRVSVALAACDGAPYLGLQLESLLGQTVGPDEIVICDDSRDDATFRAVEPLRAAHPDLIRYRRNPEPLGVAGNFEQAISLTSGEVILLADQDDFWEREKIEKLVAALPEGGGAFCDSVLTDAELRPGEVTHWQLRGFGPRERAAYRAADRLGKLAAFCRRVPAAGHNMAFDAALKSLLLPFPALPACHDTWIGLLAAAVGQWAMVEAPLTRFRQHGGNLSQAGRHGRLHAACEAIRQDSAGWTAALYRALLDRLAPVEGVWPEVIALLADRQEHSAARAAMTGSLRQRLPLIWREYLLRRYFVYGRGWQNIGQDLLLRSFVAPRRKF